MKISRHGDATVLGYVDVLLASPGPVSTLEIV
jgi:hypothetical protein